MCLLYIPRPESPQRAVELARERLKSIKEIAKDLGITKSCLRNWMSQAAVDDGRKEGLTTDERAELTWSTFRQENQLRSLALPSKWEIRPGPGLSPAKFAQVISLAVRGNTGA
jgi:transposase-like protein